MNKFIGKCVAIISIFFVAIALVNYFVDPAMIFRSDYIDKMVSELSKGNIISISREDMDERILQEKRIKSIDDMPDTVVLGSSRVMMARWEFDCYDAGVSGAVLEDYLGIVGLLEAENKMPERIVIGVDPWVFNDGCRESRYKSIQNYVDYELKLLANKDPGTPPQTGSSLTSNIDKLKELVSLSYFQSSAYSWVKWIIRSITPGDDIVVINNDDYGSNAKILPNGIRIPQRSRFLTADECSKKAKREIASNDVYLVSGFESLSEEKTEIFTSLIDNLLEKGISVEFYLPAWFPDYYDVFMSNDTYSGVIEAEAFLRSLAAEKGIAVHGSYDPSVTGITESDFLDDLHLLPDVVVKQFQYIA